jgi:hypothetical protein
MHHFSALIFWNTTGLSELNLDLPYGFLGYRLDDLAGEIGGFTNLGKATQEVGRCRIDRIFRAIA